MYRGCERRRCGASERAEVMNPPDEKNTRYPLRSKKNQFILLIDDGLSSDIGAGRSARKTSFIIRALIEQHPQESRRTLSTKLCEAWQWAPGQRSVARHGVPRTVAHAGPCRPDQVAAGELRAALTRWQASPDRSRCRLIPHLSKAVCAPPATGVRMVRRTRKERLWNSLLEEHHYLGYEQRWENTEVLVLGQGRRSPVWHGAGPASSGQSRPLHGWSAEERRRNVRFLA